MLTASGIYRAKKCPPSVVLSSVSSSNEYAERGTEFHKYLERCVYLKPEQAAEAISEEYREICLKLPLDVIWKSTKQREPEMAYAVNFQARTARFIGRSIGRNYGELGEWEVAGSADLISRRDMDENFQVSDYKTGDAPGPRGNMQLMFFAAALYLLYGVHEVEGRIVYIDPDTAKVNVEKATYGTIDLEDFIDDLVLTIEAIKKAERRFLETGTVSVNKGKWCDWCPGMTTCPAYAGLVRNLVPDMLDVHSRLSALTPEQRGIAWLQYREAEGLVKEIGSSLKAIAANEPIPIGEDKVVLPVKTRKTSLDGKAAFELAEKYGASKEELADCYRRISYDVYRVVNREK